MSWATDNKELLTKLLASSVDDTTRFKNIARREASNAGLHPELIFSMIEAESNWNPKATSSKGAKGLMQLIDSTASSVGVQDPYDPVQNIRGGVAYIKSLIDRYNGDLTKALAAYNAGQGNVDKHNGIPPFKETQEYVPKVLDKFKADSPYYTPPESPNPSKYNGQIPDIRDLQTPESQRFLGGYGIDALSLETSPDYVIWKNVDKIAEDLGAKKVEPDPRTLPDDPGTPHRRGWEQAINYMIANQYRGAGMFDEMAGASGREQSPMYADRIPQSSEEEIEQARKNAIFTTLLGRPGQRPELDPYEATAGATEQFSQDLLKPEQATGRFAKEPTLKDMTDPKRFWQFLMEGYPTTVAMVLPSLANPSAGMISMFGGELGNAVKEMDEYEMRSGIKIDIGKKAGLALARAAAISAMERISIDKLIGVGKAASLKKDVMKAWLGSIATEDITEGGQRAIEMLSEDVYDVMKKYGLEDYAEQVTGEMIAAGPVSILGGAPAAAGGYIEGKIKQKQDRYEDVRKILQGIDEKKEVIPEKDDKFVETPDWKVEPEPEEEITPEEPPTAQGGTEVAEPEPSERPTIIQPIEDEEQKPKVDLDNFADVADMELVADYLTAKGTATTADQLQQLPKDEWKKIYDDNMQKALDWVVGIVEKEETKPVEEETPSKEEVKDEEITPVDEVIEPEAETKEETPTAQETTAPATDVVNFPVSSINTDIDRFQNRLIPYSERTVERIVREYDENKFDPIVVWNDPKDGKAYVLSGHSRLEAKKQLKSDNIPARIFKGSEEEAINFAKIEGNRLADPEKLAESITAYKQAIKQDYTKTQLKEIFGGELDLLDAIQHLNPKGEWIRYLGDQASGEFPYLKRFARWVGQLRGTYKDKLTDAHETQLFDFIYREGKKNVDLSKDDFFKLITDQVDDFTFNPDAPLGLKRGEIKTGTRARADTADVQKEIDELKEQRKKARTPEEVKELTDEIDYLEKNLKEVVKNQSDLFGQPGTEDVTTPPKKAEVDKEVKSKGEIERLFKEANLGDLPKSYKDFLIDPDDEYLPGMDNKEALLLDIKDLKVDITEADVNALYDSVQQRRIEASKKSSSPLEIITNLSSTATERWRAERVATISDADKQTLMDAHNAKLINLTMNDDGSWSIKRLENMLDWLSRRRLKQEEVETVEPKTEDETPPASVRFNEGDRVKILRARGRDEFADRTGVILKEDLVTMGTIFGGNVSTSHYYQVRTDSGAVIGTLSANEIELTEDKPDVVPDIIDPRYPDEYRTPRQILNVISYARKNASDARRTAARRRIEKKRHADLRYAADKDKEVAEYQAAFDEWASKYPEEAAKYKPKESTPKPAPTPQPTGTGTVYIEDAEWNGKKYIDVKGDTKANKDRIKAIPGARWNKFTTAWRFPKAHEAQVRQELADLLGEETSVTEPKTTTPEEATTPAQPKFIELASTLEVALDDAIKYKTPISGKRLFEIADQIHDKSRAEGGYDPKSVYDALELAVNRYILKNFDVKKDIEDQIAELDQLLDVIPKQTVRTEDTNAFQQFSTPWHYAALVNWVAGIVDDDVVLEPSAGTGNLAVFAKRTGATVIVNEITPRRNEILKDLGFDIVKFEDAEQINNILPPDIKPSVVIMNPPFSSAGARGGVRGIEVAERHIEQAFRRLIPGGRLVAIVGAGLMGDARAPLTTHVKANGQIRASIILDRDVYGKLGTTFPTKLLVIDKVAEDDISSVNTQNPISIEKAAEILREVLDERQYPETTQPKKQPLVEPGKPKEIEPRKSTGGPSIPVQPPTDVVGDRGKGSSTGQQQDDGQRIAGGQGEQSIRSDVGGTSKLPVDAGRGTNVPEEGVRGGETSGSSTTSSTSPRPITDVDKSFGSKNKIVTRDEADQIRENIRKKLGGRLSVNIDPEFFRDGAKLTVYYLEAGVRAFADYAREMINDFGERIIPFLRRFYGTARRYPGIDPTGLSSAEQIDEWYTNNEKSKSELPPPKPEDVEPRNIEDTTTTTTSTGVTAIEDVSLEEETIGDVVGGSLYEVYHPRGALFENAKPSPTDLVESAAMAAIRAPNVDYVPNLPKEPIESGAIHEAQLEGIARAGQAHAVVLPNGQRRGFLVGDGTGTGKGRMIAGIIMDNWRQGRKKAIWFSEKVDLFNDAMRDLKGIGWEKPPIFKLANVKAQKITQKTGIMFVSYRLIGYDYNELQAKIEQGAKTINRIDQILSFIPEDYDGVIVFDESHNLGNAIKIQGIGGNPSKTAISGDMIQNARPNARIVYVSATAATEVKNMAYASRLGLWGEGRPFANVMEFVSEITRSGVSAMEKVASDLKALGLYVARNLSYKGVEHDILEHKLTQQQHDNYNTLAQAWQIVIQNIREVIKDTNASAKAKGAAESRFWGAQQRFFNHILTTYKLDSTITDIEMKIAEGYAPVIQLVNTQESTLQEALADNPDEDIEDLDLTPRQVLMQLLNRGFPIIEWEIYLDDNGNEQRRPARDSYGNFIINQKAVEKRDALLDMVGALDIPDGPLEKLIRHFGHENIAEVTGRKDRIIWDNGKSQKERRKGNANETEAAAFNAGDKKILVFSMAGGTGVSYHSDKNYKNQKRRVHYLLQPGWRADKAVQGLGRTHRNNQANAPYYRLVSSDIKGEKRFVSSIARRIEQLGALTKGQRETGGQGMFNALDNLESEYAERAIHFILGQIQDGGGPIDPQTFERITGLTLIDQNGNKVKVTKYPPKRILNRMLSMEINYMNDFYDAIFENLMNRVEEAIAQEQYDQGVEDVKADRIDINEERIVYEHPETGAKTKYVQFKTYNEPERRQLNHVKEGAYSHGKQPEKYILKGTNKIFAVFRTHSSKLRLVPPSGKIEYHDHVKRGWMELDPENRYDSDTIKYRWQRDLDEAPEFDTDVIHLITGIVMPVWDRLPNDLQLKLKRVKSADGRRFLGIPIRPSQINDTLGRLGAARRMGDADQVIQGIYDSGNAIELVNKWRVRRAKVMDVFRPEIVGPDHLRLNEMKRLGVLVERPNNYKVRFFIPTGEEMIPVFRRLVESYPVSKYVTTVGGDDISTFRNDTGMTNEYDQGQDLVDPIDEGFIDLSGPAQFISDHILTKRVRHHVRYWLKQGAKKDPGNLQQTVEDRSGNHAATNVLVSKARKKGFKLQKEKIDIPIREGLLEVDEIKKMSPEVREKLLKQLLNRRKPIEERILLLKDKTKMDLKTATQVLSRLEISAHDRVTDPTNKFLENNNLAEVMADFEITAEELVDLVDDDAVTFQVIESILEGFEQATPKQRNLIAKAIGIEPDQLFQGYDEYWLASQLGVDVDDPYVQFMGEWKANRDAMSKELALNPDLSASKRKVISDTINYIKRAYSIDIYKHHFNINPELREAARLEIEGHLKSSVATFIASVPKWKKLRKLLYDYVMADSEQKEEIRRRMPSKSMLKKAIKLDTWYHRMKDFLGEFDFNDPESYELNMDAIVKASDDMLNYYLSREKGISGRPEYGVPIQHLMHRFLKSMNFRKLYGEIMDPVDRIMLTADAQMKLQGALTLLNRVFENGNGTLWSDQLDPDNSFTYHLPNKPMLYGRLADKFVTHALHDVLVSNPQSKLIKMLLNGWRRLLSTARVGVLYLPPTLMRNLVTSYYGMALRCGDALDKNFWESYSGGVKLIKAYLKNEDWAVKEVADLARGGVIDPWAQSLIEGIQPGESVLPTESIVEFINGSTNPNITASKKGIKIVGKNGIVSWGTYDKVLTNMWKSYAALDYPARYAAYKAHLQRQKAQGIDPTTDKAKKAASEWVKEHYQNVGRTMRLARSISKTGFGDFVVFPFDSARIAYNAAGTAIKEAKKKNWKPLIGFFLASGFWLLESTAIVMAFSKLASKILPSDIDDDDDEYESVPDESQIQALRHFDPWYYRDSNILRWYRKNGNLIYVVADYMNFYPFESAVISAIQQENPEVFFRRTISELAFPSLVQNEPNDMPIPGMVPQALIETYLAFNRGVDKFEQPITKTEALTSFFINTENPAAGITKRLYRYLQAKEREEVGDMSGYQKSSDILESMWNPLMTREITPYNRITSKMWKHKNELQRFDDAEKKLVNKGFPLTKTEKERLKWVRGNIDRIYREIIETTSLAKIAYPKYDQDGHLYNLLTVGASKLDLEGDPVSTRRRPRGLFTGSLGEKIYNEDIDLLQGDLNYRRFEDDQYLRTVTGKPKKNKGIETK